MDNKHLENKFQAFLENSSDVLVLVDEKGNILYESPGSSKIIGYEPAARIGKSIFELVHPDEIAPLKQIFGKLLTEPEKPISAQFRLKHSDGSWRWIEGIGKNELSNSQINAVIINYRDITDRKRVELELSNSYQLLHSIYDQVADVLFYLGVEPQENYRFISVNMPFYQATGLREDQVIGKSVKGVIPEPSLSLVLGKYKQAIEERKPISWIEITPYPSGKKYGEVTVAAVFDGEGICTNLVGTVHDITNLKLAEDKLIEQREQIEKEKTKSDAMLASIGDGVVVIDKNKKIILINKAGEKLLGWKAEEIIGKTYSDVWYIKNHKGNIIISQRPIEMVMGTREGIATKDYSYVKRDGSDFPVYLNVSPLIHEGELLGATIVFHDINQEKMTEKAKTEFVQLASHKLRTPLTAINWNTELLLKGERGELDENKKKLVEAIYRQNQYMVEIVNNLLNVSLIDTDTFAIEPEPLQVLDTAEIVISKLQEKITHKKLKFTKTFQLEMPIIPVDQPLIQIIIQNMLTNAINYTPNEGVIEIEIKTVPKDTEIDIKKTVTDSVLIRVTDTGCGIPEKDQVRIFSKLFRASNINLIDTDGLGVGLYIVKSAVNLAGGIVWFNSTENQGSTFFVLLPRSGMVKKIGEKMQVSDPFNK